MGLQNRPADARAFSLPQFKKRPSDRGWACLLKPCLSQCRKLVSDCFSNRYETRNLNLVLCVQLAALHTSTFFFKYAKPGQVRFWHLQPIACKFEFL